MKARRFFSVAGTLLMAGVFLVGCRSEEQNRFVRYEPGVYKGQADTKLTESQRRALRARSDFQGGSVGASGGGASKPDSGPISRPELGKLNVRTRNQKGS